MIKINFMNKYLQKYINKSVVIGMNGFLKTIIYIDNFRFGIYKNILYIKNKNKIVLRVIFNEVRYVICENEKVLIDFNFSEKILICKNS